MPDRVQVEMPRVVERDRVLEALRQRGHEARPLDDDQNVALEVPCGGESAAACSELLAELEALVGELDVPLVPVLGDGAVFLRPPAS
ncbi:MAG: hypothetical protein ICV59_07375 [Thermoleophilia bacterium]|nr:hypothetical protein [Thermoleophilia bacterium]